MMVTLTLTLTLTLTPTLTLTLTLTHPHPNQAIIFGSWKLINGSIPCGWDSWQAR